ncbi:MAG: hypothetical protein ACOX5Z_05880 [Desulfobulbus sp.]|jgi:hypothetical protein
MRSVLLPVLFWLLLTPAMTMAGEGGVVGHYVTDSDPNTVRLLLNVQEPVPTAFIVWQRIPDEMWLVDAVPPPSGFRKKNGGKAAVKWLFRYPQPGPMEVRLRFSHQVALEQLEGAVTFRRPDGQTLVVRKFTR